MRIVFAGFLVTLVACGGHPPATSSTSSETPTAPGARVDLHCTPQADFDEAACATRGEGCGYGPPLICRGVDVPDEVHEQERRAYEAGSQPCQCICAADHEACARVP
jgi:hypothetical protein